MVGIKRFSFFVIVSALLGCSDESSQKGDLIEYQQVDSLNLIPYPKKVEKREGYFELSDGLHVHFNDNLKEEGEYLISLLSESCNFPIKVNNEANKNTPGIYLNLQPKRGLESYILVIDQNSIHITAGFQNGIMCGIQTLRQLFVTAFQTGEKREKWYLPCLSIDDSPQFQHRGLLLDVCRHFFDKEVVKKYIDALAYYKMNVLHLHLTEDQGWRMPIEKYPLLNEISSWRLDSNGNKYGGFYTKAELKELVKYAEERYITIIPEIELPGHAQAALAAYPQFSCNGGPIEVVNDWGVFKEIYCAGNDSTFTFIEDILTEVMEIFPSKYIHIGGDEAPKFRWEHCPKCQKRMKDEGLSNEHELQSYFIKRIERFLNKNERQLIGWDEILEGGLSDKAIVQFWRGMDDVTETALQNPVILSPTSHCYLDYSLSSIDLRKIYSFDPFPAGFKEKYDYKYDFRFLGGECNMWTEHVPDEANLDSKVFPRMIALAEVLWTYNPERDFDDFYHRLQNHYPYLESHNIKYGLETIGATLSEEFSDSVILIHLDKNLPDLTLKYGWSTTNEANLVDYDQPIPLKKSGVLCVQAYKNNKPYGQAITQNFSVHKALNKSVSYSTAYNQWYVGNGDKNLVDGKTGSIDFHDGNWQGFWGENIDVMIDLGAKTEIRQITANFYQYANSWIFLPKDVEVQLSDDQQIWHSAMNFTNNTVDLSNKQRISEIVLSPTVGRKGFPSARYIRFKATNLGKVPAGHEAEGQDAWLFIDEIRVE